MNKLLNDIILNYIQVKESILKSSTIARYSNLYHNHIKYYFENISIFELTNQTLQNYVDSSIRDKVTPIVIKEAILLIKLSLKREAKFGEICALNWNDIDLKKRQISVNKTLQ